MKIIVLHGENTEKSYERFKTFIESAKKRTWEVVYLDDLVVNFQEVLSGISLFGSERFFILRDIKRLGKKDFEWLNKRYIDLPGTFIIYSDETLTITFLKSLPKDIKVEEFKLPVVVWNFLEALIPGNSNISIGLWHRLTEKEPPEFIFSLIAKLFRDLYWVKVDLESVQYPTWRVAKLKAQASKFTEEQLSDFIDSLSHIDIEVKTSKAELVSALDLLILKKLQ